MTWSVKTGEMTLRHVPDKHVASVISSALAPGSVGPNVAVADALGSILTIRQGEKDPENKWGVSGSPISALAWLADGRSLVTGGATRGVLFWKGATGDARQLRVGHEAKVTAVAVWVPGRSGDARLLVSADENGCVKLTHWAEVPGRIDAPQPEDWEKYPVVSPDGRCRAEFNKAAGVVKVLGPHGEERLVLPADGEPSHVGFSPDGKRLVAEVTNHEGTKVYRTWTWLTEPTPDEPQR